MLAPLLALILASPDAGTQVVVPWGDSSWNAFQVLALSPSLAAVREVTYADVEAEMERDHSDEMCTNPGMAAVLKGRRGTETLLQGQSDGHEGVILHAWRLPPAGSAELASGPSRVVYRSGTVDGGCTSEADAKSALEAMKRTFADAGVDLARPPEHVDLLLAAFDTAFKGNCYETKKGAKGCTLEKTATLAGAPVTLSVRLSAPAPCANEWGCQVTRRYTGTLTHRGSTASFDLLTRPNGGHPQLVLESAAAFSSDETTIGVLFFSWTFVSTRSKVPVVVRVR